MAQAVREARAAQARIREEDEERARIARLREAARAQTPAGQTPAEDASQVEDGEAAEVAAGQPDPQERSDDPNALPDLTGDRDDEPTRTARPADDTQAPRPTGRVRPVAPGDDAEADADEQDAERGQPVRPRPPMIAANPRLPDNVATDEELEARLDAVESDLRDALRQDLRAEVREDVLAEANQRIEQAIAQTETEVARLREAMTEQEARSDQRIAQLRDRLEVLQSRDATASTRGVLILALSNLRGELDAGRPFERQLRDVERLAPNVTSLEGARPFAAEGLPTDSALRSEFREAAREAATMEARAESEGFFGKMMANIKGLFSVREIGEVEGETTAAIISRAEAALQRGNVTGAVRELRALDGPAADAFEPFLERADAKAVTRVNIERLERAVLDADQPRAED